jgi:hypothetical protein
MENIVYLLGAGFSAPLGLPLMSNFWQKAKEVSRVTEAGRTDVQRVLEKIKTLGNVDTYFDFDQHNIEQALSVLEFSEAFDKDGDIETLKQFVLSVITYYTPKISWSEDVMGNLQWPESIFGPRNEWQWYGHFVASLFGLNISQYTLADRVIHGRSNVHRIGTEANYSVITLNYDLVLERFCECIQRSIIDQFARAVTFCDPTIVSNADIMRPNLVKLHGSASDGKILLPTFNKTLQHSELPVSWRAAHKILMEAHKIRIIGYSLPQTDSYIKYLLMSAIGGSAELEQLDVICKDDAGDVKTRFDSFIRSKYYRFINGSVEDYLGHLYRLRNMDLANRLIAFDRLEKAHSEFMLHQQHGA